MPVDKFGRRRDIVVQDNVSSDVSFTQMDDYFIRRDGSNTAIGSINMTGNTLTNVSIRYTITMQLIKFMLTKVLVELIKFQDTVIRWRAL